MPDYSTYTYDHPSFLVRYPHVKRNKLVSAEIQALSPDSWLDYGAGDGALIREMERDGFLPNKVTCYEPDDDMRRQLQANLLSTESAARSKIDSIKIVDSSEELVGQEYQIITVLEVLEHLPLPERVKFYQICADLLPEDGVCLIEVPIEYGPVLLLKEFGRRFLKGRKSEYSLMELFSASLLGKVDDVHERYEVDDSRSFIVPHHGFDLERLKSEISAIGKISEVFRSPFPFFPRWLNQTVLLRFTIEIKDKDKIKELVVGM